MDITNQINTLVNDISALQNAVLTEFGLEHDAWANVSANLLPEEEALVGCFEHDSTNRAWNEWKLLVTRLISQA